MPSARPGQPNIRREPFGMPALLASGCLLAALFAPANHARADQTAAQTTAASGDTAAVPAAATERPRRGKHGGGKHHGGGEGRHGGRGGGEGGGNGRGGGNGGGGGGNGGGGGGGGGGRSGLAWNSGSVSGGFPCLAQLRGRPLDARTIFITHTSFPDMVRNSAVAASLAKEAPFWVVSLPLLPSSAKGQFAQCAGGAYDSYFRDIGANLAKGQAQTTYVRLGWEANIGSDSHPWGVNSNSQIPAYKACFRRAAQDLKSASGGKVKVEWTNAKKGSMDVMAMYPGDDVVDSWGVHYYDSGPIKNTQKIWDQYYNAKYEDNPWGLGAWLAAARAHGKKLGVGEWGIWNQGGAASASDDPIYMQNMFKFFKANASSISYETYFNAMPDQHTLCPSTRFPKSAATYKALWHAG